MEKIHMVRIDYFLKTSPPRASHGLSNPWAIKRWNGLLDGKQGETLLDVGCGTGFVTILAAKAGLRVTAVDWSEGMMGKAKEKAKEEGLDINFVCSDTEGLPFEADTFQNLTARHVIWTLTNHGVKPLPSGMGI